MLRSKVPDTKQEYKFIIDAYFFDKSIELDLKKAKEEGERNKAISIARILKIQVLI